MWVSPHLLMFTIYFVGSGGSCIGFLTRDPSLIWNTDCVDLLLVFEGLGPLLCSMRHNSGLAIHLVFGVQPTRSTQKLAT